MKSCLWNLAPCKLTALLLWVSEKRAGNQHKKRPEVVLERVCNLPGPGLPRAAPTRTCWGGVPELSAFWLHLLAGGPDRGGFWELQSLFLLPGGLVLHLAACHLASEVSPGGWSFTSAVAWSSSLTWNYNFHLALRFWLPILSRVYWERFSKNVFLLIVYVLPSTKYRRLLYMLF